MNARKKIMLMFAVILLFVILIAVYSHARSVYWREPWLRYLKIDVDAYGDGLQKMNENQDHMEDAARQSAMEAEEVPEICREFLAECDDCIVRFLDEVYHVDVSEKMERLSVMSAEYPPEVAETVGGSHHSGIPELKNNVFINRVILDGFLTENYDVQVSVYTAEGFYAKMLCRVYIHEVLHYLGFTDEPSFAASLEAFTEALTEKLMRYCGIKYENTTGYAKMQKFAAQILEADEGLVYNALTEADFCMGTYFNEKLGMPLAEDFDLLMFLLQNGQERKDTEIPYLLQYIVNEYQKVSGVWEKSSDAGVAPFFEIWWLLAIYWG